MKKATVVIPNYNGIRYIKNCLDALKAQDTDDYCIIVVDNGSEDGSMELIRDSYPDVQLIALPENIGFAAAVNIGIKESRTPYVILLNNDTEVERSFVRELTEGISSKRDVFSASAKLLKYDKRDMIDDAGDMYCALGWAFAIGKDKKESEYNRERELFAACAGAAIYRKRLFKEVGYFDERHFAYLEDIDIGYRARIHGYKNVYLPKARVYHMGSATTGSRYNEKKVRLASRNSIYLVYKNMPAPQIMLNLPFLIAGVAIKQLFFIKKGLGTAYFNGLCEGFDMCRGQYKVNYTRKNLKNYVKIQLELWKNMIFLFR